MLRLILLVTLVFFAINNEILFSQTKTPSVNYKGDITNKTPSKALYFDWINSNWYGSTEHKVLQNLKFFKWLHEEYGMQLDIYLLDAGNIDNGPNCSGCVEGLDAPAYGGLKSEWFLNKFPNGLDSIYTLANSFGCRLGTWLGPDGFGDSPEEAKERINMYKTLVDTYNVALYKLDRCCSDLRPEKEDYFIQAMEYSLSKNPGMIILNHRINLSDKAEKYTTTFLWEGAETYIGVSERNTFTSPHHRYTLTRGLPPELKRLTEDHGVCLSSYLDYWEDDLVLQAFNRNLILSPEIYGNPWLLKDEEFPRLARIFNLHRKYKDILVHGKKLPKKRYGKHAVSRGDNNTRLITLRNLKWTPKNIHVELDKSVGLSSSDSVDVWQYHPTEKYLGKFEYGSKLKIEVRPFRSCLLKMSSKPTDPWILKGCDYHVIKQTKNEPTEIKVLGMPGETSAIQFQSQNNYKINLEGTDITQKIKDQGYNIKFEGKQLKNGYHYKLANAKTTDIPNNTEEIYEAMCYAANNNALEVRSLNRSGKTNIPAVKNARDAFFKDTNFINTGAWDKYCFDNDMETYFKVKKYCNVLEPGLFRIDMGDSLNIDKIVLHRVEDDYHPVKAELSKNLSNWTKVNYKKEENKIVININSEKRFRSIRLKKAPWKVAEIKFYKNSQEVQPKKPKASNLFKSFNHDSAKYAWDTKFKLTEKPKNGYLAVAVEGEYPPDGIFAAIKVDDKYYGAPERSPAYQANFWEHHLLKPEGHFTFYFPVKNNWVGKSINVEIIGTDPATKKCKPEVWMTAYPVPFKEKKLILKKQ